MNVACRVCCAHKIDMRLRTRQPRVVAARRVYVILCRHYTTMTYPQIASRLRSHGSSGKPRHSTVITTHKRARENDASGRPEYGNTTIRELCDAVCDHFGIDRIGGEL